MCSELTPRAHIPDTRIPQLMQPCISYILDNYRANIIFLVKYMHFHKIIKPKNSILSKKNPAIYLLQLFSLFNCNYSSILQLCCIIDYNRDHQWILSMMILIIRLVTMLVTRPLQPPEWSGLILDDNLTDWKMELWRGERVKKISYCIQCRLSLFHKLVWPSWPIRSNDPPVEATYWDSALLPLVRNLLAHLYTMVGFLQNANLLFHKVPIKAIFYLFQSDYQSQCMETFWLMRCSTNSPLKIDRDLGYSIIKPTLNLTGFY